MGIFDGMTKMLQEGENYERRKRLKVQQTIGREPTYAELLTLLRRCRREIGGGTDNWFRVDDDVRLMIRRIERHMKVHGT